ERDVAPPEVRALLEAWDGTLEADGAAGALTLVAYRFMAVEMTERIAGGLGRIALGASVGGIPVNSAFSYRAQSMLIDAAVEASPPWFEGVEDRDRRLRGALARAAVALNEACGTPSAWQLG